MGNTGFYWFFLPYGTGFHLVGRSCAEFFLGSSGFHCVDRVREKVDLDPFLLKMRRCNSDIDTNTVDSREEQRLEPFDEVRIGFSAPQIAGRRPISRRFTDGRPPTNDRRAPTTRTAGGRRPISNKNPSKKIHKSNAIVKRIQSAVPRRRFLPPFLLLLLLLLF